MHKPLASRVEVVPHCSGLSGRGRDEKGIRVKMYRKGKSCERISFKNPRQKAAMTMMMLAMAMTIKM